MATSTVTKETGARIKPGPMVVAAPPQVVTDEQLAEVGAGSGLNPPFLADLLSSCLTHERDGINLYRALASMTANPLLHGKYRQLHDESRVAVEAWEELVTALGGNIAYASPPARMTEAVDSMLVAAFLQTGSADPVTVDLKTVEAVLLAATLCLANVELLDRLRQEADDGPAKTAMATAVGRLRGPAGDHLDWARQSQQTLVATQATHPVVQKVGQAAEKLVGKVKDLLR